MLVEDAELKVVTVKVLLELDTDVAIDVEETLLSMAGSGVCETEEVEVEIEDDKADVKTLLEVPAATNCCPVPDKLAATPGVMA